MTTQTRGPLLFGLGIAALLLLRGSSSSAPTEDQQRRARLNLLLGTLRRQAAAGQTSDAFTTFKQILGLVSTGVAGLSLANQAAHALGLPANKGIGESSAKFIFDRIMNAKDAVEAAIDFFTAPALPGATITPSGQLTTTAPEILRDIQFQDFVGSETQAGAPGVVVETTPAPVPVEITDLVPSETAIVEAQQTLLTDATFLQAAEDGWILVESNDAIVSTFTQAEIDAAAAAIEGSSAAPVAGEVVTVGNVLAVVGLAASIGFILAGDGRASEKALGVAKTAATVAVASIISAGLTAAGITSVLGVAIPAVAPWLAAAFPVAAVGIAIAGIFGAFDAEISHAVREAREVQRTGALLTMDDSIELAVSQYYATAFDTLGQGLEQDLLIVIEGFARTRGLGTRQLVDPTLVQPLDAPSAASFALGL